MPLELRDANLDELPQVIKRDTKHVSLGDLHGNALKLIYIMIEEGILELNEKAYIALRDIYNTPVRNLKPEQLKQFETIIAQATVNPGKAVTLIGDELADRGNNDYFTLLVLQKLRLSKVPLDIMLSNHSAEFIRDYAKVKFTGNNYLGPGQAQSLANMHYLIAKGLVKEGTVRHLVEQSYQRTVKAIGYSVSPEGEITLFSHAPIGLETVQGLANKYGIPYNDSTPKDLIRTIDKINKTTQQLFSSKQLAREIDRETPADPKKPANPHFQPLQRLVWNRAVGRELVTTTSSGIKVNFVHGHVGDEPILKYGREPLPSHQNLDSSFGKFSGFERTGYNQEWRLNIQHFTRHSNDFLPHQLNDKMLNRLFLRYAMKDVGQQFTQLLGQLKEKTDELIAKGTPESKDYDPKYKDVAGAADSLYKKIHAAAGDFFDHKPTIESCTQFNTTITEAITKAEGEFAKNRNAWNDLHPVLKGVIGFFALITVIPALVIAKESKHGFFANWLSTPGSDSSEKLEKFKQSLNGDAFKDMKNSLQQIKDDGEDIPIAGPKSGA